MIFYDFALLCCCLLCCKGQAMYKEPAVRTPSLSRLKEIAQDLGLDVDDTELQEYQRMSYKILLLKQMQY